MVSGIQLIGVLFALVQSYFTFLHFKRREFTLRELWGWEILWIGFAAVSLYPDQFKVFAGKFGTFRPLDFFVVVGFIVVLSISFYTYVNLDRLRKKIEKAIREMALSDLENPPRKNK